MLKLASIIFLISSSMSVAQTAIEPERCDSCGPIDPIGTCFYMSRADQGSVLTFDKDGTAYLLVNPNLLSNWIVVYHGVEVKKKPNSYLVSGNLNLLSGPVAINLDIPISRGKHASYISTDFSGRRVNCFGAN